MLHQPLPLDDLQILHRRDYRQRTGRVGGGHRTRSIQAHDLFTADHRRQGQRGADPLAADDHIRLDPVVLVAEHLPRSAETGLYLVEHHHDVMLPAEALQSLSILHGQKIRPDSLVALGDQARQASMCLLGT